MKNPKSQPSAAAVASARNYWRDLTDADLQYFWKHYTTGKGAGMYSSVHPDSSFEEYLVNSASESAHEKAAGI